MGICYRQALQTPVDPPMRQNGSVIKILGINLVYFLADRANVCSRGAQATMATGKLGGLFSTKKKGVPELSTFANLPTYTKEDSASHMVSPAFTSEAYDPEPVMKLPLLPSGMKAGFKGTPAVEFVSQLRRKPALRYQQ